MMGGVRILGTQGNFLQMPTNMYYSYTNGVNGKLLASVDPKSGCFGALINCLGALSAKLGYAK